MQAEHEKKQDAKSRIQVFVRLRPASAEEQLDDTPLFVDKQNSRIIVKKQFDVKSYDFDHVFAQDSTQAEVFSTVAIPTIEDTFNGYHGTVFVYGQTGTGKTYTISAPKPNEGIIPRALHYIFHKCNTDEANKYVIEMSYVQIYMENLQDLLSPSAQQKCQIREDPDNGVFLTGCTVQQVATADEALALYKQGDDTRATALTKMNATSSRSHACLIVTIHKRRFITHEDFQSEGSLTRTMTSGKLYLVDLAGSERIKKTEATGIRKQEANYINLSLTNLGLVINALETGKSHVPFRDSKLTRLLQDSLGGRGKTSIIVTIGPSTEHLQETISTLQFGQRAMKVKTKAKIFETIDYKALSTKLQAQIDELQNEKMELENDLDEILLESEQLNSQLYEQKINYQRELQEKDATFEQAIKELHEQFDTERIILRNQYEHASSEANRNKSSFESEIFALTKEHSERISQMHADYLSQITSLKDKVYSQDIVMKEKDEQLYFLTSRIEDLQNQFNQKKQEAHLLQNDVDSMRLLAQNYEEKFKLNESQYKALKQEYDDVLQFTDNIKQDLDDARKRRYDVDALNASLQADVSKLHQTIVALQNQIDTLNLRLNESNVAYEKVVKKHIIEKEYLEDQIVRVRAEYETAKIKGQAAYVQLEDMKKVLSRREQKMTELENQNEICGKKICELEGLIQKHESDMQFREQKMHEIATLNLEKLETLTNELSLKSVEVTELRSNLLEKDYKLQMLQKSFEEVTSVNQNLCNELSMIKRANDSKLRNIPEMNTNELSSKNYEHNTENISESLPLPNASDLIVAPQNQQNHAIENKDKSVSIENGYHKIDLVSDINNLDHSLVQGSALISSKEEGGSLYSDERTICTELSEVKHNSIGMQNEYIADYNTNIEKPSILHCADLFFEKNSTDRHLTKCSDVPTHGTCRRDSCSTSANEQIWGNEPHDYQTTNEIQNNETQSCTKLPNVLTCANIDTNILCPNDEILIEQQYAISLLVESVILKVYLHDIENKLSIKNSEIIEHERRARDMSEELELCKKYLQHTNAELERKQKECTDVHAKMMSLMAEEEKLKHNLNANLELQDYTLRELNNFSCTMSSVLNAHVGECNKTGLVEPDVEAVLSEILDAVSLTPVCTSYKLNSEYERWLIGKYRRDICIETFSNIRSSYLEFNLCDLSFSNRIEYENLSDVLKPISDTFVDFLHLLQNVEKSFKSSYSYLASLYIAQCEEYKACLLALHECSKELNEVSLSYNEFRNHRNKERLKLFEHQRAFKAALTLQKHWKLMKRRKAEKEEKSVKEQNLVAQREIAALKKAQEEYIKSINEHSARTGIVLMQQSFVEIQQYFRIWSQHFANESSAPEADVSKRKASRASTVLKSTSPIVKLLDTQSPKKSPPPKSPSVPLIQNPPEANSLFGSTPAAKKTRGFFG